MKVGKQIKILILLYISFSALIANGCPCGCGAVNPQVLNPGENWKITTSAESYFDIKTVKNDGDLGNDGGPETKNTMLVSISRAISNELSLTTSLPFQQNMHSESEANYGAGDPSFSGRWTVLPQNFANPWKPQVQLFSTFKYPFAKSIYDELDEDNLMDVHGNGFVEFVPGFDVWFGMTSINFGLSQGFIIPFERTFDNGEYSTKVKPGNGSRTTLTGSYTFIGFGTYLVGLDREVRVAQQVDSNKIPDSEIRKNSIILSGSIKTRFRETLGVMLTKVAAFGDNKNTTQSTGVQLSYMMVL